ncbi:FAD:protein FMN transferase [Deinococcus psychrotolerans]|uniref:FAD:protein FMN transferase n=1 Tax=Deinococcus psychrotolerans TaxID=2489213 RepID=UPI001F156C9D|nr:FAD:protein FMN transferase [Deinococcus psychrotolerans]
MSRTLSLHALGSQIVIQGEGAEAAACQIEQAEALLTRFQASPLTELNARGVLRAPPSILVEAIGHALSVARQTAGLVTPAVLTALEVAGYAQTLGERRGTAATVLDTSEVVCTSEMIRLPAGLRLDLGGTAKSWIAERAFTRISGDGFINAGGDLITRQSAAFAVDIAHPLGGTPLYLDCPAGTWGVATSSTLKRAWEGGHHLIDPRTARPLESDLIQVTVIGNCPTDAEVLTKLAFLDTEMLDELQGNAQVYAYDRAGQFWIRSGKVWQKMET